MLKLEELLKKINTPGWDWPEDDFSWLTSKSGLTRNEPDGGVTSIFFIHGGRIREQAHIPEGRHGLDTFIEALRSRATGLDDPCIVISYSEDGTSLWLEGTRMPREDDIHRLEAARERQRKEDDRILADINKRRGVQGL
jgi:hypothetical protein